MSRRGYPVADRYDERESDFYRRPRQDRNYDDIDIDVSRASPGMTRMLARSWC